jgi:hypothetical protein
MKIFQVSSDQGVPVIALIGKSFQINHRCRAYRTYLNCFFSRLFLCLCLLSVFHFCNLQHLLFRLWNAFPISILRMFPGNQAAQDYPSPSRPPYRWPVTPVVCRAARGKGGRPRSTRKGPVAQIQYDLFMVTVYVCVFLFVVVGGAFLYVVWKYRERPGQEQKADPAEFPREPADRDWADRQFGLSCWSSSRSPRSRRSGRRTTCRRARTVSWAPTMTGSAPVAGRGGGSFDHSGGGVPVVVGLRVSAVWPDDGQRVCHPGGERWSRSSCAAKT